MKKRIEIASIIMLNLMTICGIISGGAHLRYQVRVTVWAVKDAFVPSPMTYPVEK